MADNWALWAAAIPAGVGALSIIYLRYRRSPRGQLRSAIRQHRKAIAALDDTKRAIDKARIRQQKLQANADKTRPRLLQEASDALVDAEALNKIATDKILIAANQVRRVIFEEFPPNRHTRLRRKFLPQDIDDDRPFSMGS